MKLPFTEDYTPDLEKSILSLNSGPVSLDINPIHRYLFVEIIFVCFSEEQLYRVKSKITAAGKQYNLDCNLSEI